MLRLKLFRKNFIFKFLLRAFVLLSFSFNLFASFDSVEELPNFVGRDGTTTPPPVSAEEKARRLLILKVTPESYKKDRRIGLPRLAGEKLAAYQIEFGEDGFFTRAQGQLKYQIIYFLHKNGILYGMTMSHSEDNGFQHSSFDREEMGDCLMAGEMNITSSGVLMNDESGHYKPGMMSPDKGIRFEAVASYLRKIGYEGPTKIVQGGF